MLELIIGVLIGALSAILLIHPNTVVSLFYELSSPSVIAASSLCFSFVASTFLGMPDSQSNISMLPSHKLVSHGHGGKALKTMAISTLIAGLIVVAASPLLPIFYEILYKALVPYLFPTVLMLTILLFLTSKKIYINVLIFLLAGLFGMLVLNSDLAEPLLSLFTGLFGIPSLLFASRYYPKQKKEDAEFLPLYIVVGSLLGIVTVVFPAFNSPSLVSALVAPIVNVSTLEFLVLASSVSSATLFGSIMMHSATGKARQGFLAFEIPKNENLLYAIMAFALCSALLYLISDRITTLLRRVDMEKIRPFILLYLASVCYVISGLNGVMVMLGAVGIGVLCILIGAERRFLMGSLLIPTLILLIHI